MLMILLFLYLLLVSSSPSVSLFLPAPARNHSTLVVPFTYIEGAATKGAVCLDGTLPGYNFHHGHGSGTNSWLINFEGGGWCNDVNSCLERKFSELGSSARMIKPSEFIGILSNKAQENPDFFNWNRVKLRYCDGASFAGEGEDKVAGLQFRGERIYKAAMDDLMSKGMRNADQALLSGGSAGAVAAILNCDHFGSLFPTSTRVKCLSDAGLFIDTVDISGRHSMRNRVQGVVSLQGVQSILPRRCTSRLDPISCFFPQNLINYVKTPLFILNAAYDYIQVQASIAPNISDPKGSWLGCKLNFAHCSTSQIHILQKFRNQMVQAVQGFGSVRRNGFFINSCFAHGQSDHKDTWFSPNSLHIGNKGISRAVGDWYFDRSEVKIIGCPYPCEKTCHNVNLTTSPY